MFNALTLLLIVFWSQAIVMCLWCSTCLALRPKRKMPESKLILVSGILGLVGMIGTFVITLAV